MAALWIGGLESHREGGRIVKAIGSGFDASAEETKAAASRAIGSVEKEMDAIEASKEWNAAMESEIMKGPKRQGTRGRLRSYPHRCRACAFYA
jgi:hypothetical protein